MWPCRDRGTRCRTPRCRNNDDACFGERLRTTARGAAAPGEVLPRRRLLVHQRCWRARVGMLHVQREAFLWSGWSRRSARRARARVRQPLAKSLRPALDLEDAQPRRVAARRRAPRWRAPVHGGDAGDGCTVATLARTRWFPSRGNPVIAHQLQWVPSAPGSHTVKRVDVEQRSQLRGILQRGEPPAAGCRWSSTSSVKIHRAVHDEPDTSTLRHCSAGRVMRWLLKSAPSMEQQHVVGHHAFPRTALGARFGGARSPALAPADDVVEPGQREFGSSVRSTSAHLDEHQRPRCPSSR